MGKITAVSRGAFPLVQFIVQMSYIKILKCIDTMGSNNTMVTSVALLGASVKWVYYRYDAQGKMTGETEFRYPE